MPFFHNIANYVRTYGYTDHKILPQSFDITIIYSYVLMYAYFFYSNYYKATSKNDDSL